LSWYDWWQTRTEEDVLREEAEEEAFSNRRMNSWRGRGGDDQDEVDEYLEEVEEEIDEDEANPFDF